MRIEDNAYKGLETLEVEETFKIEGGIGDGTPAVNAGSPASQLGLIIGELIFGKK